MSLRKKGREIKRLIKLFEDEAGKFHDLKFSTFFVTQEALNYDRKFKSPNHTIMLWQYYGKIDSKDGSEKFIKNVKYSNLKWGICGAELSSFAVLEGSTCDLFARMAKRAGSLFNEKEVSIIKARVTSEIVANEKDKTFKPTLSRYI